MKTFIKITAVLLISLFTHITKAQKTGEIKYPTLGISFTIPQGWLGQEIETGFIMGSNITPGFIIMSTHNHKDLTSIKTESLLGITDNQGTSMKLTGNIEKLQQNTIGASYTGLIAGESAKAYIIGMFNPYGLGITIMIATNTKNYTNKHIDIGLQLAKSVHFYKPETASTSYSSTENSKWSETLKNCRLTHIESYNTNGGGYGRKIKIDLCAQGYFNHSSYSSMNLDNVGMGSNKKGTGSWNVYINSDQQNILQLNFYNGEVYEFELTTNQEDETYLNGDRYYKTYEGAGNYAPLCY